MNTMMPALAMRDGHCTTSFGVMGADFQPMGQAHLVTNMVDYDMDIQQAIDAPRAFYMDEITEVEHGISEETITGLQLPGAQRHVSTAAAQRRRTGYRDRLGHKGNLIGGSDHRKDGCAIGY